MSHVAVIVGVSGTERYLDPTRAETRELKHAKRFRSPDSARLAARAHIEAYPAVVQRHMQFRVEELS